MPVAGEKFVEQRTQDVTLAPWEGSGNYIHNVRLATVDAARNLDQPWGKCLDFPFHHIRSVYVKARQSDVGVGHLQGPYGGQPDASLVQGFAQQPVRPSHVIAAGADRIDVGGAGYGPCPPDEVAQDLGRSPGMDRENPSEDFVLQVRRSLRHGNGPVVGCPRQCLRHKAAVAIAREVENHRSRDW